MSEQMPEYLARAKEQEALAAAKKLEAEARRATIQADLNAIDLAEHRRLEAAKLSSNVYHEIYVFDGQVNAQSVKACMTTIDLWRRTKPGCPIEVVFTSPGGSVVDGLALWDYLQMVRAEGHHLTTVAFGWAASMAGILLQAGDTRVLGRESWLMIHEASFASSGKIGDVEDTVEWVKRVQERVLNIFASRSTRSKAAIKRKWTRKDWFLSSDEALAWGFIDEIR